MTPTRDAVTVVDCVEYEHVAVDPSLWVGEGHSTRFNSEIDGRDVLRANFRNGVLQLQATSYVGVIPLNDDVLLRVRPRVPLGNLTRMVVETGHSVLPLSAFRDYSGRGSASDWTMDIYTDALLDHLDTIIDAGLVRTYERREGEGHFPHGRIDFTRTLHRFAARGVGNKAAYSWFERSVDTAANRCLKAAMQTVYDHLTQSRSQPRKGDRTRLSRLSGHFHSFDDVHDDADYTFLNDQEVRGSIPLPDSRSYYRPALDLALLILQDIGIALDIGGNDVALGSLLIDTNKLFEKFVRISLSKHAKRHKWPAEVLDGNTDGSLPLYSVPSPAPSPLGESMTALAEADPGRAQPDVVIRHSGGGFPLVAEVKNTAHGKDSDSADVLPNRSEVEQAVTYALRYDLPFTILIHPWIKGTKGLVYVGRVQSIDVYDYRLDLSSETGVDVALADMGDALGRLAGLTA